MHVVSAARLSDIANIMKGEKEMKKVVALLMAAVMTVGMATVAFAAPSPAATTGTVKEAVDAKGKSIELVASDNYAKADQAAAAEIKSDAQAVLKKVVPSVNAADYKLAMLKDVAYVGEGTPVFPVKVTLNVDGVTAASKVIVLHYVNGAWQQETAVAGNGTVTVTLNSLSPVAIYVEANGAATAGNGSANGSANGAKLSPKTGAAPTMTFVVAIAAAAVAGMCVTAKKKNA